MKGVMKMKRGRKPTNGNGAAAGNPAEAFVKSTYMMHPVLKQNLALYAITNGIDQSDIMREALADYLRRKKIDPTKPPRFHDLT